jgi:hypothetical protein
MCPNTNGDVAPQFIAALAPGLSTGGNYRLKPISPAINVGNNAAAGLLGITTDITGGPRIQETTVDLGAYEQLKCPVAIKDTLYVNATNTTSSDGSTWATSYNKLQDALLHACNCPNTDFDVWVSQGNYYPDEGVGRIDNDQNQSFVLCGINLYGGFLGTETLLSQRDWISNQTILSGDIDITPGSTHNSYQLVVVATGTNIAHGFILIVND